MNVICPTNVGVSQTSPLATINYVQSEGGTISYTLSLIPLITACPVTTYKLASSSPAGVLQANCFTPANTADCQSVQIPLSTIQFYTATYTVGMDGGNSFPFVVRFDVQAAAPTCYGPFIQSLTPTTPFSITLGSTSSMALSDYTWTNPIMCNTITTALSSVTSTAGSIVLSYDASNSRYKVTTGETTKVQTHTFYLTISGTDGKGSAYSEVLGPYTLNVMCPTNVGVS